jgi:hypothetical protein
MWSGETRRELSFCFSFLICDVIIAIPVLSLLLQLCSGSGRHVLRAAVCLKCNCLPEALPEAVIVQIRGVLAERGHLQS